ncbi:MAG: hypothetical protein AAFQ21_12345 [Pseudomonadota bacterium]
MGTIYKTLAAGMIAALAVTAASAQDDDEVLSLHDPDFYAPVEWEGPFTATEFGRGDTKREANTLAKGRAEDLARQKCERLGGFEPGEILVTDIDVDDDPEGYMDYLANIEIEFSCRKDL